MLLIHSAWYGGPALPPPQASTEKLPNRASRMPYDFIHNAAAGPELLLPYAETSMLHLCEAEILAACGDGSVELVPKVLVAIILWKVELCKKSQYTYIRDDGGWIDLRLKQV